MPIYILVWEISGIWPHQISHAGRTVTNTSGNGSEYLGVTEIDLGTGDLGLSRLDTRVRIAFLGFEVIHFGFRYKPLGL